MEGNMNGHDPTRWKEGVHLGQLTEIAELSSSTLAGESGQHERRRRRVHLKAVFEGSREFDEHLWGRNGTGVGGGLKFEKE
jgi:hypothetical protein